MRWCAHAVKFRQTTNHILLTNTEKQKETQSKKQENRENKLQLAKTGIGQKDNTKKSYITPLLRVTIMHTLTENVKKGGTAHTWYTWKTKQKIATTIYTGTKKNAREEKKTSAINWQKSQCKKYEGRQKCQAQKKHDYTTPTTWEEKNKLVLVNHHVPQTPPHVYQINLVILLSRQPHTTEIKKKTKFGNAFCQTTQLGWTPYWGKAKKNLTH